MIDEISAELDDYRQKWSALVAGRSDKQFFETLKPTAVGWKVADRAKYDKAVAGLHEQAESVFEKWMNGRWIAKIHLKGARLVGGVEVVKILQRRPGSTDAAGLDHVDFYALTGLSRNREVLAAEPGLKWSLESNDVVDGYDWLSVWFDGLEAKIKSDTVFDTMINIIRTESSGLNGTLNRKESQ